MHIFYVIGVIFLGLILLLLGKNHLTARKGLILLVLVLNGIYLYWRFRYTLPTNNLASIIIGSLLLFAEFMGFLQLLVFYLLAWNPKKRKAIPISALATIPTVDILIATYNEPSDILKRTAVACQLLHYPSDKLKIHFCDDGKRDDIRKLANELGVGWITRDDNENAKAGNLNNALSNTTGDFIVTLDADMIPRKEFLRRTMGYFCDEKVAFVQAPQSFYNDDPFQHNLFSEKEIVNEQDFFMRNLEPEKDRFNAIIFIGSNAVFRRTALNEIGGFSVGVITEDMATGMILQANGWKSVYVNELLAAGLAPETYEDMLKQRDRWCRGNIQVGKKWNPLFLKGLNWIQKILYLDGIHYWFLGFYKIIYILVPIIYMLTGILCLNATVEQLVIFWLPALIVSQMGLKLVASGRRTMVWSHVFETALAPFLAKSVLYELFLHKSPGFKVTRKGVLENKRRFLWRVSYFHVVVLLLSLISFARIVQFLIDPAHSNLTATSAFINGSWLAYNTAGILMALFMDFERPRYRKSERFSVFVSVRILEAPEAQVSLLDLSENGARISVENDSQIRSSESFNLKIGESLILKSERIWTSIEKGIEQIGIAFPEVSLQEYRKLIDILYSNPRRPEIEKRIQHASLFFVIYRFFKNSKKILNSNRRKFIRSNASSFSILSFDNQRVSAQVIDESAEGCQVQTAQALPTNSIISLELEHQNLFKQKAEVKWSKERSGKHFAGLHFLKPS